MSSILLYGCYGYTGRLLAAEALRRGHKPTLAGRNKDEVEAMGRSLDLPTRAFSLDDTAALDAALSEHTLVIHAAGPFSRTSRPMVDACLRTQKHYLDVTGEIGVFEACASRDAEAKARGITVLPGVGFDVVPSDCMAAYVAQKLPGATHLVLALQVKGKTSQGTSLTMVENIAEGGAIRRDGRITRVPSAYRTRDFDFGNGPRTAVTIPWGDVSTAYYSTNIPNIEVYLVSPTGMRVGMKLARYIGPLLASRPVQKFLHDRIKGGAAGPSDDERASGVARIYAEASNGSQTVAARYEGPDGYTLTAHTGILAAEHVLGGKIATGFQTPSRAFGADFVLQAPNTKRVDL